MESAQVAHHDHGDFDGFTSFLWQIIEADNKVHDFVKAAQSKGYKVGEDALKDAKSLLLYIAKVNTVHTTQNAVRNIMEEIGYDYSKLYTAYRSKVEEHSGSGIHTLLRGIDVLDCIIIYKKRKNLSVLHSRNTKALIDILKH